MSDTVPFWSSPELVGANRLPMHAVPHSGRMSLDGSWDFQLLPAPDAPADGSWRQVEVPGCWTMQDVGDSPIYTNVVMPFPLSPPDVPARNPTGLYERDFRLPPEWAGRRVVLHVGAAEGALSVTLNGRAVGLSKDSHLAAEFDITAAVTEGLNRVTLRVARWSDASYIEDQDQWWQAGLTRPVFLYATGPVYLADIRIAADLQDDLSAVVRFEAMVSGSPAPGTCLELTSPLFDAPVRVAVAAAGSGPPEERDIAGRARSQIELPRVEAWSAELPRLSDLTVTLLSASAEPLEAATFRIGFRRVRVVGTSLLINGAAVLIRGVNRHDFDPRRGHVVSPEGMRAELVQMKQFGFNAIRTSHYPNDPQLLDLCDELGLYVIDEADIEGHAFYRQLPDDSRYLPAWVDRVSRMVLRDKNHPCIIAWSLGNETGYGSNHRAAAAWVRSYDGDRPLHYEGAVRPDWTGGGDCSDLTCPMYPPIEAIVAHARSGEQNRPLIMCEYSHAMGNSNGCLAEYWDAIEATEGLQGGFIWEWRDHGLVQARGDGTTRWAYGGDFGEEVHDGNFCIDGVVFPDGAPKPALWEHKQLAAPVRVTASGAGTGGRIRLEVENRQSFRDLTWLRADFELAVEGRAVRTWTQDLPAVAPQRRGILEADVRLPAGPGGETWLTVHLRTATDLSWAPAGHEVCWAQVPVSGGPAPAAARRPALAGPDVDVDADGLLVHRLLSRAPELSLWRAPTDNDRISGLARRWEDWGVVTLTRRVTSVKRDGGRVTVQADVRTGAGLVIPHTLLLTAAEDGAVTVEETAVIPPELQDLARVGTVLETVGGFEELSWFGPGPQETYPDRKRGGAIAQWQSTVTGQHTGYVKPQEEGGHADVRWATLRDGDGRCLTLRCTRPAQVTISHFDAADLAGAGHVDELRPRAGTVIRIDAAHRGLGTASCGPDTLSQYRLGPGTYTWGWTLRESPAVDGSDRT